MKIIKMNGLKFEITDTDYDFFQEEIKKLDAKGKDEKASILRRLVSILDEEREKGNEITVDFIEKTINQQIDDDKIRIKELKRQIKSIETEINMLGKYSQREQDDGAAATIL